MATEIKMPQLGLTMTEGAVGVWHKKVGDEVKKGDILLEITTDKLNSEIQSEVDGVLIAITATEGQDVPVMGVLGYIGAAGEKAPGSSSQAAAAPAAKTEAQAPVSAAAKTMPASSAPAIMEGGRLKISPLAKKTAQKMGINPATALGTGPGGRIIQKDILTAAQNPTARAEQSISQTQIVSAEVRREKLKGMRKTVGQRMRAAAMEIPSVTINMKVNADPLLILRAKINEGRQKEDRLSVNDFILKAAARALSEHKEMLLSLDGDEIVYNQNVNLGIAVALDEGLIVPVLRDADKLSIETISKRAKDLAKRARENKLSMDEYQGSTFTISNLGMYGVESFTSIINQPNCAILGVAAALDEIDIDAEGKVYKKKVMKFALTIDHRLMDGAVGAKFAAVLRDLLETPLNILL